MRPLPITRSKENLFKETNEGYVSLSKWLIALSTAAIAFGASLVKPNTAFIWKQELFFGLGLLVISILAGVRSVRLKLDYTLYNLETILNTEALNHMKGFPVDEEQEVEGVKRKAGDIVKSFEEKIEAREKHMDRINTELCPLFNWQQWLFYSGITLIAIFGVASVH
ncbi:MAG: hypothetical protein WCY36_06230 [Candidatus Omnitrophota bacterium]